MTVVTVDMDTERTRARHRDKRDKTQDVFAEESEALDQIVKQADHDHDHALHHLHGNKNSSPKLKIMSPTTQSD